MPSPFPGMNPYLESDVWHGFHQMFVPACSQSLVPQVRPDYIVTLEETVYVHELPDQERLLRIRPDVSVLTHAQQVGAVAATAVLSPPEYTLIRPAVDVERESYIAVRDRHKRELVCVIELLSPANKRPGPDREAYIAKRDALLRSQAHLIEIDLLRGWERMPAESISPCDYCVTVSRVEQRPRAGIWPIRLDDPLPKIPVPLRDPHPDAVLDLQQLLHSVYDAAGFDDYLYESQPEPPFSPQQASWAARFLPSAVKPSRGTG
jgi:hypothetical protein